MKSPRRLRRVVKKAETRTKTWRWRCRRRCGDHQAHCLPGGMTEQELEVQVESEANQYIRSRSMK